MAHRFMRCLILGKRDVQKSIDAQRAELHPTEVQLESGNKENAPAVPAARA